MKKEKMLKVDWNDKESCTYYIDKDKFSKAHKKGNIITLDSFSGIYTFDKDNNQVTLNDGANTKIVNVKAWKFYETPTI